jgi:NADH:ubiquinone oxidoreductase subunit H
MSQQKMWYVVYQPIGFIIFIAGLAETHAYL